jgi:hypothetical protein
MTRMLVSWPGFRPTVRRRTNELFFRVRLWGRAHALIGQRLEGVELVGAMHGLADFVFCQADLGGVVAVERVARHRKIGGDLLLLRHEPERGEPSFTGDDLDWPLALGFTCKFCSKPWTAMLAASYSMPLRRSVLRTLSGEGTGLDRAMYWMVMA